MKNGAQMIGENVVAIPLVPAGEDPDCEFLCGLKALLCPDDPPEPGSDCEKLHDRLEELGCDCSSAAPPSP